MVRARPARNGPAEHTQTSARGSTGAAEETVPASVPALSLSEVPQSAVLNTPEDLWEALQQRVSPPLAARMQHGRPLTLDEDRLVVGFPQQSKIFFEDLLEQPNKVLVENAVQELLGRRLRIDLKLFDAGVAGNPDVPGTGANAEQEVGALDEVRHQKNELKQAVIDIFGATPI